MKNEILTQARLKELLHYSPDTGVFIRKVRTSNAVKVGDVAGYEHKSSSNKYYIQIVILGEKHYAHALAVFYVTGKYPAEVDHDDGDGLNNKWLNLNDVSHSRNMRNTKLRTDNSSGVCGISFYDRYGKWEAKIKAFNKHVYLGRFYEKWDAICARKSAEFKYGYHVNHGRVTQIKR